MRRASGIDLYGRLVMWGMNSILFGLLMKVSEVVCAWWWGSYRLFLGTRLPDGIYLKAEERQGEVPEIYNLRISKAMTLQGMPS